MAKGLFRLANEHGTNIVLSEVSEDYSLDMQASKFSTVSLNFRNQEKLRAYQREYARQKRAPGRRKVSKAERQLLEDQYVKRQALMGAEGPSKSSSTSFSQYVLPSLII